MNTKLKKKSFKLQKLIMKVKSKLLKAKGITSMTFYKIRMKSSTDPEMNLLLK